MPSTWRIRADVVEPKVEAAVRDLLCDAERVLSWLDAHVEVALSGIEAIDARVADARTRIGALEAELQRLERGYVRGVLTEDALRRERRRIAEERRAADAALAALTPQQEHALEKRQPRPARRTHG